ncbi:unnamed protein product [Arctogadus glacialis]
MATHGHHCKHTHTHTALIGLSQQQFTHFLSARSCKHRGEIAAVLKTLKGQADVCSEWMFRGSGRDPGGSWDLTGCIMGIDTSSAVASLGRPQTPRRCDWPPQSALRG